MFLILLILVSTVSASTWSVDYSASTEVISSLSLKTYLMEAVEDPSANIGYYGRLQGICPDGSSIDMELEVGGRQDVTCGNITYTVSLVNLGGSESSPYEYCESIWCKEDTANVNVVKGTDSQTTKIDNINALNIAPNVRVILTKVTPDNTSFFSIVIDEDYETQSAGLDETILVGAYSITPYYIEYNNITREGTVQFILNKTTDTTINEELGEKVFLASGDSAVIEGKTLEISGCSESSGQVNIDIEGQSQTINVGESFFYEDGSKYEIMLEDVETDSNINRDFAIIKMIEVIQPSLGDQFVLNYTKTPKAILDGIYVNMTDYVESYVTGVPTEVELEINGQTDSYIEGNNISIDEYLIEVLDVYTNDHEGHSVEATLRITEEENDTEPGTIDVDLCEEFTLEEGETAELDDLSLELESIDGDDADIEINNDDRTMQEGDTEDYEEEDFEYHIELIDLDSNAEFKITKTVYAELDEHFTLKTCKIPSALVEGIEIELKEVTTDDPKAVVLEIDGDEQEITENTFEDIGEYAYRIVDIDSGDGGYEVEMEVSESVEEEETDLPPLLEPELCESFDLLINQTARIDSFELELLSIETNASIRFNQEKKIIGEGQVQYEQYTVELKDIKTGKVVLKVTETLEPELGEAFELDCGKPRAEFENLSIELVSIGQKAVLKINGKEEEFTQGSEIEREGRIIQVQEIGDTVKIKVKEKEETEVATMLEENFEVSTGQKALIGNNGGSIIELHSILGGSAEEDWKVNVSIMGKNTSILGPNEKLCSEDMCVEFIGVTDSKAEFSASSIKEPENSSQDAVIEEDDDVVQEVSSGGGMDWIYIVLIIGFVLVVGVIAVAVGYFVLKSKKKKKTRLEAMSEK